MKCDYDFGVGKALDAVTWGFYGIAWHGIAWLIMGGGVDALSVR